MCVQFLAPKLESELHCSSFLVMSSELVRVLRLLVLHLSVKLSELQLHSMIVLNSLNWDYSIITFT